MCSDQTNHLWTPQNNYLGQQKGAVHSELYIEVYSQSKKQQILILETFTYVGM
jgi:hypothetical protein